MILVTGATGMFGSRVVRYLAEGGHDVRALTHSPAKAEALRGSHVEPAIGDMEDPASLARALEGVKVVFLVSPMDDRIAVREQNTIAAAKAAGVQRVVKVYGAIRLEGEALDQLHQAGIQALKDSGLGWSLVSPNAVMETNLFPFAEMIRKMGQVRIPAGTKSIGMVAADDVARCAAVVLTTEGHEGMNYEITGPAAVTFEEIAAAFSRVLGRPILCVDAPEAEFAKMMVEAVGLPADQLEIGMLSHYRAFRRGGADLVTDTCERLTGRRPMSVEEFICAHKDRFERGSSAAS